MDNERTTGRDHESQASPSEGASTHDGPKPELIEVASGKTVAVITPKIVFKINGNTQDMYDVLTEATQAVDDFVVLKRYRREGAREASFMYSLAVYCVPAVEDNLKAVRHCLASTKCRSGKCFTK